MKGDGFFSLLDLLALGVAFFSFFLFLLAHIIVLRYRENWPTHQVIQTSFGLGILSDAAALLVLSQKGLIPPVYSRGSLVMMAFASVLIYGLLVFHYIVWVFGMGEAAIRIRLLRELENRPSRSATLEEIRQSYNAEKILQLRLERLVGSGHLSFDGRSYALRGRILFFQDFLSKILKQWLGIKIN